jgi:hypothetical protein
VATGRLAFVRVAEPDDLASLRHTNAGVGLALEPPPRGPTLIWTAGELAERIGCTIEQILDALEAAQARDGESLDRPLSSDDDGGFTLGERL